MTRPCRLIGRVLCWLGLHWWGDFLETDSERYPMAVVCERAGCDGAKLFTKDDLRWP